MRRALPLRHIVGTVAIVALTAAAGASARPDANPSLRVRINGEGTVNTRDGRIDCGQQCSARYRRGAVVSLFATPERFFGFDHWTGGCVGNAPRCFVVLDRAKSVRAVFSRKTARVTMSVSGPGTVRSSPEGLACGRVDDACDADLPVGAEITLTPTADLGGVFGVWNEPCRSAGQGACTLVLEGDVEILAAFGHTDPDPDEPLLTVNPEGAQVTSDPPGIDCPPTCQAEFLSGTYVTIRGNISKWSGLCVGVAQSCAIVLDNSDGAGTGGAPPPPPPRRFGVNIRVTGPGLVESNGIRCRSTARSGCAGFYSDGATLTLRATPGRGSRFVFWSGFCIGKQRTCTLRVTATKSVQALFRR